MSVVIFIFTRHKIRKFEDYPDDPVAVLIPSYNEGERALEVINSLLNQDHSGLIEIYLLLKDNKDSSMPYLKSHFPNMANQLEIGSSGVIEVLKNNNHKVAIAFTGVNAKSAKINWISEKITTPYLGIIDCDHQAHVSWIRSSLCMLREQRARIIQCRRGPISARGFFKFWDSMHQHIGCELFNAAFSRLGLTVFFTGTTAIMESNLLKDNPLRESITEDADFSYNIFFKGVKIISNPYYGSFEELSPNLYSFLARRRRWANGHTETFFRHLVLLPSSTLCWKEGLQFLYHGCHYLVALLILLLQLIIGLFFIQALSIVHIIVASLVSLILTDQITRSQRSKNWGARLSEILAVFLWIYPAVIIIMNLVLAFLISDWSQAALPMPYIIQILGLVGFGAPLLVLLVGMIGYRQLSLFALLKVILTFPLAFFLDIAGVVIGLFDYLAKRHHWHAVTRSSQNNNDGFASYERKTLFAINFKTNRLPMPLFASLKSIINKGKNNMMKPSRLIPWLLMVILFIGGLLYTSPTKIRVTNEGCTIMKHDGHPWIVPPEKLYAYCVNSKDQTKEKLSTRIGTFQPIRADKLLTVDPLYWDRLNTTFPCNQAVFAPENIEVLENGGIRLHLKKDLKANRQFSSGSIATKNLPQAKFLYGRFETVMKPIKLSGVVTAFFLYRFDPWQEIDMEFLGNDTTKVLLNVYYNPGEEGDLYNYGYRGTPILIDLGFDAANDLHSYAIEWDTEEIRWFVDNRLIHSRKSMHPTPIPHLPMRFHVNTWPTCSKELAGTFDSAALPVFTEIKSIAIYQFKPAIFPKLSRFIDSIIYPGKDPKTWRDKAKWLQPQQ